jgi:hypothetical protein
MKYGHGLGPGNGGNDSKVHNWVWQDPTEPRFLGETPENQLGRWASKQGEAEIGGIASTHLNLNFDEICCSQN